MRDEGRFRREVRALSGVSHPNLIDYYGSGTLTDMRPPQFWISMPNLSGLTLADLMRQGLDLEQKLLLASQILSGLKALHSASLTHRDLKPENALIGDNYELKLTDFGLSKSEMGSGQGSLATMQGAMMGTPAYMSPEQVQSKPVESYLPSDVWAFGVILFELLTGRLIFTGNLGEVWGKIQYEPIQLEDPAIPPTLLPILKRCVVRDLSQRGVPPFS